jgi:hypothetical protein
MKDFSDDNEFEELSNQLYNLFYDDSLEVEYRKDFLAATIAKCEELLEEIEQEYY